MPIPRAAVRFVLAPDKFKGTLTAAEAAAAMVAALRAAWPEAEAILIPMADGGEGTLEAILQARGGRREVAFVEDASGVVGPVEYGVVDGPGGPVAVVESARIVGRTARPVPVLRRTTVGLGRLIVHLRDAGFRRFWIGLGGSLTNDGGLGLLAGLGARFRDAAGRELDPAAESLFALAEVDLAPALEKAADLELSVFADVGAPLVGPDGATFVFGPQKGLPMASLSEVDAAVRRFAERVCDAPPPCPGGPEAAVGAPGAGAAGGLGFALARLGARLLPGADGIAELVGLEAAIAGAHFVVTGEGQTDRQTLFGKVPAAVARLARLHGRPVFLLSGRIAVGREGLGDRFAAALATVPPECAADPPAPAVARSRLEALAYELFSALRAARTSFGA
ncbi:glycerate kinase [Hydrogenibacillus schlegelii]|uniref:Glycerate kinase n=2 Tax=Hydrogenibacillus schlegelii TaxID=1484 RepID=A0A179IMB3_HYDSH|nr:glycerate kinase [Hydrogenibacillus schlegelii]OAR03505.1 hypothetical protein SA87_02335 [Hydrogenibacillus schlegelii]